MRVAAGAATAAVMLIVAWGGLKGAVAVKD